MQRLPDPDRTDLDLLTRLIRRKFHAAGAGNLRWCHPPTPLVVAMTPSRRLRAAASAALAVLALQLITPSGADATARRDASLSVTPGKYVAGQRLVFEGNIGRAGKRRWVHLQLNVSRPGDPWRNIDGTRHRTRRNGHFHFGYRAPAMSGLRMRVASGRLHTPAKEFHPKAQDLVLTADGDNEVTAGRPFDIRVDTTPTELMGRKDLPPPPFPGRELTLQRRDDSVPTDGYRSVWQDVATAETDAGGIGVFHGLTADQRGTVVYRVRQEDWTRNGDRIGWFPSFPTYVTVVAPGMSPAAAAPETATSPASTAPARAAARTTVVHRDVANQTASEAYRWGASLWDFGWTYGESLTSRPHRGTDRHGRWLDTADGTGRVAPHNGALMLDSQRENTDKREGSQGTTRAMLRGNPMRYGRWEVRLRMKSSDTAHDDYRSLVELVPDSADAYDCGAHTITVAQVTAHGSAMRIGARSGDREWTRRVKDVHLNNRHAAIAVEVTRRHITWFLNGRPVGNVKSRAAVPDQKMTMRLSLEGDGQQEMNRTQAIYDWMRGYSLERGRKVARGGRLASRTVDATC